MRHAWILLMASAGTWAAIDASPLLAKAPLIYHYSSQWYSKAHETHLKSYRWCRGGPRGCSAWDHSGKSPLPPQGSGPAPGQNGPGVVFFNPPPQETGHSGSFGSAPPAGSGPLGFTGNWGGGIKSSSPSPISARTIFPRRIRGARPGPRAIPLPRPSRRPRIRGRHRAPTIPPIPARHSPASRPPSRSLPRG